MMIPDNYDLFGMHEREIERNRRRLPVCAKCGEPITSEKAYDIDGWCCENCFDEWLTDNSAWTEDLIECEGW